jgi:hypothetical protein
MTTGPIQRPSSPSVPSSVQRAEAKPTDAPATAEAKPVDTQPAKGPAGGAATAETTFARARDEAPRAKTPDYAAPSTLSRTRPAADAPADVAAADQAAKSHYPVKWEAEATLKSLKADPRVKGDVQMQLGRMIGSPGFDALGPKGQVAALELFRKNLDDPDALKRVRDGVNSLDGCKSKQGRLDVLEGLQGASPLSQETLDKTKELLHSSSFTHLNQADQELVTSGLKAGKCDPKYAESLKGLVEDPKFKALKPEEKTKILTATRDLPGASTADLFKANLGDSAALARAHDALGSLGSVKSAEGKQQVVDGLAKASPLSQDTVDKAKALLASPQFGALSEADQKLVTEGIQGAKADPKYTENLKKLLEDPKFAALKPEEQTAVLSQTKNYPDARSVDNVQKMLQKDWFTGFDLADKQRSLKMVAFLSQHDAGDQTVIQNTLGKFLGPSAPYTLDFNQTGGAYGSALGTQFHLNRGYIADGNDKVDTSNDDTMHMSTHTFAHEVNHLVNGDRVRQTYDYFNAEYRGFFVGFKAQNGREPTRDEVLDRVRYLLTATDGAYDSIRRALADPVEGPKIVEFMKGVLGRDDVTQANAATLAVRDGGHTAPRPTGNLDNH